MRLSILFLAVLIVLSCGDREKPVAVEPAGKVVQRECTLAEILMDSYGCADNPTLDEVPEGYEAPEAPEAPADSTDAGGDDGDTDTGGDDGDDGDAGDEGGDTDTGDEPVVEEPDEPEVDEPDEELEEEEPVIERTAFEKACDEIGRAADRLVVLAAIANSNSGNSRSRVSLERGAQLSPSGAYGTVYLSGYSLPNSVYQLSGSLYLAGSGASSGVITVHKRLVGAEQAEHYILGASLRVRHSRSDFAVYDGHCGDLGTYTLQRITTKVFNILDLLGRDAEWAFEDYLDVPTGGHGALAYRFTGVLGRRVEYGRTRYSRYTYRSHYYSENTSSVGIRGSFDATYDSSDDAFPVEISGSFTIDPRNTRGSLLFPNPGPWTNSIPNS